MYKECTLYNMMYTSPMYRECTLYNMMYTSPIYRERTLYNMMYTSPMYREFTLYNMMYISPIYRERTLYNMMYTSPMYRECTVYTVQYAMYRLCANCCTPSAQRLAEAENHSSNNFGSRGISLSILVIPPPPSHYRCTLYSCTVQCTAAGP